MFRRKKHHDLSFEESLGEDWSRDIETVEVPIGKGPFWYLGGAVLLIGLFVTGRVLYLGVANGNLYAARAENNVGRYEKLQAPRGLIYDREGKVLAENRATFAAILDIKELLREGNSLEKTLIEVERTLSIPRGEVLALIQEKIAEDFATPLVLKENLNQSELVALEGLGSPALVVRSDFTRVYTNGSIFAPVIGYVGRVSAGDMARNLELTGEDIIGKAGIESFYDDVLSGEPGEASSYANARGAVLTEEKRVEPSIGESLHLTIDAGFQEYFYERLRSGLVSLGRTVGLGLAIDPRSGEVLAMVDLPSYDNNVLSGSGNNKEKMRILNSEDKPLFDRIVSGFYSPGSTVKPLVGVAALKEGVIDTKRQIYSSGALYVPNPYNASSVSRHLDWRPQGYVNLSSAIAQSSDVYFYIVGGGSPPRSEPMLNDESDYGIKGLGISSMHEWWEKFGFGKITGIDMPNEAEGFLPTPEWKQERMKTPWLLGDTYNVSIGQGDLLVSPLQLLDYIIAIANGGTLYRPFLNKDLTSRTLADFTDLLPEIQAVQ